MEELKKRFVFIDEQLGAILVGDAEEFLYVFREMSNHIAQATRDAVRVEEAGNLCKCQYPKLEQGTGYNLVCEVCKKESDADLLGYNRAISAQEKKAEEWLGV